MDDWLDEQGLYRKNTALDPSCLFRSVAEQVMPSNPINGHLVLRRRCVKFIVNNRDRFENRMPAPFEEYVEALANPKTWAGPLELDAISMLHSVDFEVFIGPEAPLAVTQNGFDTVLMLCVTGQAFYDAVYRKSTIDTFAFCQSLTYKILYGSVFKLDDLDYAVDKMLHDKAARALRERYISKQSINRDENAFDSYLEDAETPVNVRKILDTGAILFPYKVAKALDADIFRNIDFDNWVESQRGKPSPGQCLCALPVTRRSNFWLGNGGPLRVGVKCHVRIEDKILTGHIQDMSGDTGPVLVFIEELSQKLLVSYENLIPVPRASLKPEWSYSHKHQLIHRVGNRNRDDGGDSGKRRIRGRRSKDDSNSAVSSCEREEDQKVLNEVTSSSLLGSPTIEDKKCAIVAEADSTAQTPSPAPKHLVITPSDERNLVNTSAPISTQPDFSDLPLNDMETLRFFYNMGVEYFRKGTYVYGPPLQLFVTPEERNSPWTIPMPEPQAEHSSPMIPSNLGPVSPLITSVPPPSMYHPLTTMQVVPVPAVQYAPPVPPPTVAQTVVAPPPVLPTVVAPPVVPPPVIIPPAPVPATPPVEQSTPIRESKERGRNSKFNKPPRFKRLESETKNLSQNTTSEEVQFAEISSTTPSQEFCQYAYPPQTISYAYSVPVAQTMAYVPENDITGEPYLTYDPNNTHYYETIDTGYQAPYPMYTQVPVYYH